MKTATINGTTRFILFTLAAMIDMVASTLLFVTPIRAAQLGASYSLSAGTGVAWGLGAALMTLLMGKFVTQRNAAYLCIAACLAQAAVHVTIILFATDMTVLLPLLFAAGLTHTMYYVPYQVFFKTVDSGDSASLQQSVGIYTFSWSVGMAVGPFWSGFLFRETLAGLAGWQLCFVFTVLTCLVVAAGIRHVYHQGSHAVHNSVPARNHNPDFARLAWVSALCGTFAFSLVRSLFPAGAVRLGVSEDIQGGVIFCMGICQALSALLLTRIARWMYKPGVLGLEGAFGAAGMLCFLVAFLGWLSEGWMLAAFFAGAILFGIYSGSYYFYTGFHCLVHPERAGVNIAASEGMMSVANVIGLLLGGAMADRFGINSPYLAAGAFVAAFTILQAWLHKRRPALEPTGEELVAAGAAAERIYADGVAK